MRYLVTGGAGFLGSNLCDYLIGRGDQVLCVDNYITGSINNVKHLLSHINFSWLEWDVTKYLDVQRLDGIFHLASPASPYQCNKNGVETLLANTLGTLNMLKLANLREVPILFTTTTKVKDISGLVSDKFYVYGKMTGELLCNEFMDKFSLEVKIARMGNIYGHGMSADDSRVVPTFIRKAKNGESILVYANGEQLDSFCYVDDIVEALVLFMDSDKCCTYEFGSDEVIKISYLAELIVETFNSKSIIIFDNTKKVSNRYLPDISSALRDFNWSPKISLSCGLTNMMRCS